MASTDRNLLRLAVYELLYRSDIPLEVTVNEAVELAKKYGDDESGKFVNGVLGTVIREIRKIVEVPVKVDGGVVDE
jgi:N utilization substance protein B